MNEPMKHSPGPWRIEAGRVLDANDASVGGLVYWATCDLNLALAAPELLGALEDIATACEGAAIVPVTAILPTVLAAIAKAEGK